MMWDVVKDLFKTLVAAVPPDTPECIDARAQERHKHWRRAMFTLIVAIGGGLGWVVLTYAAETAVDAKVQEAIKPIRQKVEEIAKKQDASVLKVAELSTQASSTNKLLVAKLASDLDEKIVQTTILRCKAQSEQSVEYFRQRVQEFIQQYEDLTGRNKLAPTCSDTR